MHGGVAYHSGCRRRKKKGPASPKKRDGLSIYGREKRKHSHAEKEKKNPNRGLVGPPPKKRVQAAPPRKKKKKRGKKKPPPKPVGGEGKTSFSCKRKGGRALLLQRGKEGGTPPTFWFQKRRDKSSLPQKRGDKRENSTIRLVRKKRERLTFVCKIKKKKGEKPTVPHPPWCWGEKRVIRTPSSDNGRGHKKIEKKKRQYMASVGGRALGDPL